MSLTLKSLWAQVLDVQQDHLEDEDNFFEIGGNSINALRLVDAAEHLGYSLNVPDIYRHPELCQMSEVLVSGLAHKSDDTDPGPFELLQGIANIEKCLSQLQHDLSTDRQSIEDIYPCTPLQEGLMAMSMKHRGSYIPQFVFRLPHTLDIALLKNACDKVVAQSDVLRTRIVRLDGHSGLLQVVVTHSMEWESGHNLDAHLAADRVKPMDLGDPLLRLAIIHQSNEDRYLVWTIHHAIHDRWSIALIQEQIATTYARMALPDTRPPRFSGFIKHLKNSSHQDQQAFWERQLVGPRPRHFPKIPKASYQPATSASFKYSARVPERDSSNITITTIVQSAWALTVGRHSDSDDVVFGMTLIGRDTPVTGVTRMHGPTVATVPVVMHLDYDNTTQAFLTAVQAQMNDLIPFEHFGTQSISALSGETRNACNFQNLLVIQPAEEEANALEWEKINLEVPEIFNYGLVIECEFSPDQRVLYVRVHYDPAMISTAEVDSLVHHFEQAISQLSQETCSQRLRQVSLFGSYDKRKITEWNQEPLQEPVDTCIHEFFQQLARQCPQSTAIDSWDGRLTYRQLDQLSTAVSYHLTREHGIGPEDFVPVCFDKSYLMPVAILGVLKAGAAFVPLDPSHPQNRLHHIVEDSRAKVILAYPKYRELFATSMTTSIFCLDHSHFDGLLTEVPPNVPNASTPQGTAYVIFTSGSTGRPKGVVIEHRSFVTSALAYGRAIAIDESSRVLQFSSHAFDCSLAEILTTLISGGCVCIPSDHDRLHNLSKTMNRMQINMAFLTPSASRVMTPATLLYLKTLVFVGEQLSSADFLRWNGRGILIMNGYGPTECSVISTINTDVKSHYHTSNIGKPVGCKLWIVEEEDMDRLTPVGCSGELLIEGPTLARGYLDNPELTASSFLEIRGFSQLNGDAAGTRSRCVYRTGDIVQYRPDGSIGFVRRKDGQLKIRGNRLEVSEIEHNIKSYLGDQVHVSVFKHSYQDAKEGNEFSVEFLAAMICNADGGGLCRNDVSATRVNTENIVLLELSSLKGYLEDVLPTYMVPTVYVPFREMPLTTSGKLDRPFLRRALSLMTREQLSQLSLTTDRVKKGPSTEMEYKLREWWSEILKLRQDAIGMDDSFFQLGGDSILAIHLSSIARDAQIRLDVSDIFSTPNLSEMARNVTCASGKEEKTIQPFEFTGDLRTAIIQEATDQLQVPSGVISDIYPCTPMQEALISLSAQKPGACVLRMAFHLPQETDIEMVREAWAATIAVNPILRTRIIQTKSGGTCQVVMNTGPEVDVYQDQVYCAEVHCLKSPHCGGDLLKVTAVKNERVTRLAVQIHHATYDGWSLPIIIKQAHAAFQGKKLSPPPPFSRFVAYTQRANDASMKGYWESQAKGFQGKTFPTVQTADSHPGRTETLVHVIANVSSLPKGSTLSTISRLAWALTITQNTSSSDVAFGVTLAGRNVPVKGIENMTGPTITTVPMRIILDFGQTVLDALKHIQDQAVEMAPFEQVGLQEISALSAEAARLCRFGSLLVVQPKKSEQELLHFAGSDIVQSDLGLVSSCPLMLTCEPQEDCIEITSCYDPEVIQREQMQRVLNQFSHILNEAILHSESKLGDLHLLSPEDVEQLRKWNQHDLSTVDECVHRVVQRRCDLQPSKTAVVAWDGSFTYAELDRLSSLLATHLVHSGVRPETFVPLCLERSKWTPISVLAVLKAGGAFVLLDPTFPESRLHDICRAVDASIIIGSACHVGLAEGLCGMSIVVDGDNSSWIHPGEVARSLDASRPDNAAYAVFTSGTTGKPKGIVIENRSFASSIALSAPALGLKKDSRVLHFSSYAFDVSILEILSPLMLGGCVCVPSEVDRKTDLASSINTLDSNLAMLTPSVARLLDAKTVTCLKTLCLLGEGPTAGDINQWKDHVHLMNVYGPAECSVVSTVNTRFDNPNDPANIGQPTGARHWIVDQNCHTQLVPPGTVGELLLEGPIVGRGYIGDEGKAPTAFVEPPEWITQFGLRTPSTRCYKTGDLAWMAQDGSIHFVGRKDRQAKLHGQRMELAEVEHHVWDCFDGAQQVVAEILKPRGQNRPPLLAAFIHGYPRLCHDHGLIMPSTPAFRQAALTALSKLRNILPSFMIPTAFIAISTVPLGKTGKLDRQKLRDEAASRPWNELAAHILNASENHKPSTAMEKKLQRLWGAALGLGVESIGVDDTFFHLGGDSLSAMRLASIARSEGLKLIVPDMFEHRTIRKLASVLEHAEPSDMRNPTQPFSLMGPDFKLDELTPTPAASCDGVVDVLPLTCIQSQLSVACGLTEFFYALHGEVSLDRLRSACYAVMQRHSILRTVFCRYQDRTVQAILKTDLCPFQHIVTEGDLESALTTYNDPQAHPPAISGKLLVKFTLLSRSELEHVFVIRISHLQYDANSVPILLGDIAAAYNGCLGFKCPAPVAFSDYVYYQNRQRLQDITQFWKDYLQDSSITRHRWNNPGSTTSPAPTMGTATIQFCRTETDAPHSLVVTAAFSAVLSSLTECDDLVYGLMTGTRDIALAGAEHIMGPCIATTPIRVPLKARGEISVSQLICLIQAHYTEVSRFGGNFDIREVGQHIPSWPRGSDVMFRLNHIRPDFERDGFPLEGVMSTYHSAKLDIRPGERVTITSSVDGGLLKVNVRGSTSIMQQEDADRLATRLVNTVNNFLRSPDAMISSVVD